MQLRELETELAECERGLEDPVADSMAIRTQLQALEQQRAALWRRMIETAESEVVTVRFNAWQFEDATQIWAGLAETITERLEQVLSLPARLWARFVYAWGKRRAQLVQELVLPGVVAILTVLVLALVGTGAARARGRVKRSTRARSRSKWALRCRARSCWPSRPGFSPDAPTVR